MRLFGHAGATRLAVSGNFVVQAVCVLVAATMSQVGYIPTSPDSSANSLRELIGIGFLSFQAGAQIVATRVLNYAEVPTNVLTSAYCDFAVDANVFAARNPKRDRRVCGIVLLLVGGIAGGWIGRTNEGAAAVIWMALILKVCIAITFMAWPRSVENAV